MELKGLLEREVRSKAAEILSLAQERASNIIKNAEREREKILDQYRERALEAFSKEYTAVISKAKQEAMKIILETQRDILNSAKENAKRILKDEIKGENYKDILKRLIEESIKYMKKDVEIRANPRDKEIVEDVLRELASEWIIQPPENLSFWDVDLKSWKVVEDERVVMGLIFVDRSRNFILNNDLMVRLERAYGMMLEEFRGEISVEA